MISGKMPDNHEMSHAQANYDLFHYLPEVVMVNILNLIVSHFDIINAPFYDELFTTGRLFFLNL